MPSVVQQIAAFGKRVIKVIDTAALAVAAEANKILSVKFAGGTEISATVAIPDTTDSVIVNLDVKTLNFLIELVNSNGQIIQSYGNNILLLLGKDAPLIEEIIAKIQPVVALLAPDVEGLVMANIGGILADIADIILALP